MVTPRPAGDRSRVRWVPFGSALLLAIALAVSVGARPAAAGTPEAMESTILSWINNARAARGVPPLVIRTGLMGLAGDRAASMAAAGVMSHEVAGCLSCQLRARGIVSHASGEAIGGTTYPWGSQAANSLISALSASSSHMGLLMSRSYDQVGAGVAYRSANKTTYLSIVVIDGDPLPTSPPKSSPPSSTTVRTVRVLVRPEAPNLERRRLLTSWLLGFDPDGSPSGRLLWGRAYPI